ncbi:hypothetical protein V1511DRAFT_499975 [Dipodascopsis uninucleata]
MSFSLNDLFYDSLEEISENTLEEHIVSLYSTRNKDNQNLGYISRSQRTVEVSIPLMKSLISNISLAGSENSNLHKYGRFRKNRLVKRTRRMNTYVQVQDEYSDESIQLSVQQSLEMLNSETESSTTGAVLWQVSLLFAEWILTPNSLFYELFFQRTFTDSCSNDTSNGASRICYPKIIELGAGVSGLLACSLSLGLLVPPSENVETGSVISPGTYIATDQDHIIPLLKKNISKNISAIESLVHERHKSVNLLSSDTIEFVVGDNNRISCKRTDSTNKICIDSSIEVIPLDWERASQDVTDLKSAIFQNIHDGQEEEFDIILACDTIYNDYLIDPFVRTIKMLAGPKTSVIIGIQMRSHDVLEQFLNRSLEVGFRIWSVKGESLSEKMRDGFAVYYMRIQDCRESD